MKLVLMLLASMISMNAMASSEAYFAAYDKEFPRMRAAVIKGLALRSFDRHREIYAHENLEEYRPQPSNTLVDDVYQGYRKLGFKPALDFRAFYDTAMNLCTWTEIHDPNEASNPFDWFDLKVKGGRVDYTAFSIDCFTRAALASRGIKK